MKFIIHSLKSCPSTNNVARDMAGLGAAEGTVVVAEEQTAGRGTKGRSWHSPRGKGLYVSLIVRPAPEEMPLIPLAAGLAARDAVERSSGLRVLLRWPNDIVWEGKKLGGVLCEGGFLGNRPEYAILGVGLNIDQGPRDFPDDIREQAVSIRMTARKPAKIKRVLKHLLAAFEKWRAGKKSSGRSRAIRSSKRVIR
jgi:BirA family transcriptional regulator, biotin operon repressor / biotin---[acetyl-CoA-carboxylase] ligase